jgi:hypothetical protein
VEETEVVPEIEPTITLHANTLWTPPINCRLPTDASISFRSSAAYRRFQIDIDGNLTCNGVGRSGVPILLSYSVTGGNTWDDITVATTALDGSYSAVWAPSTTGNYIVRAEWAGNATFPGSKASRSLATTPFEEQAVFTVTSNSTVSILAFNSTSMELRFTVSGPPGTTGYTEVTIAKKLIANIANLKVYIDAAERNYVATSVAGAWRLTFTYPHSSHTVVISLGETALIDWMLIGIVSIILGIATVIVVVLLILKQNATKLSNYAHVKAEG